MRFDLLHLAKDILETNAHMAREDKSKDRPSFYTTEQVISTAKDSTPSSPTGRDRCQPVDDTSRWRRYWMTL